MRATGRRTGAAAVFALVLAAIYAADWAVLRARTASGQGTRVVMVRRLLATSLKGQKVEYDFLGTQPVTCARALLPHTADLPCWWVERHTTAWQ